MDNIWSIRQILDINPDNPTITNNITVIYDATQVNSELSGYSGNVYAHLY